MSRRCRFHTNWEWAPTEHFSMLEALNWAKRALVPSVGDPRGRQKKERKAAAAAASTQLETSCMYQALSIVLEFLGVRKSKLDRHGLKPLTIFSYHYPVLYINLNSIPSESCTKLPDNWQGFRFLKFLNILPLN